MGITIEEAMKLDGLKECKLIAGRSGLKNRIRYVDTMEVPDITPWLKKYELLVTTGYSIKNDTKAFLKLINSLHEAGSSGIAVKTKFIGSISQEIINRADELDIPIIEIPQDMPIVNITDPLIRAIVDNQNRRLEFSEMIHNKFMELELSGDGILSIAEMLNSMLEMSIIITDDYFKVLAITSDEKDDTGLRRSFWEIIDKCPDFFEALKSCDLEYEVSSNGLIDGNISKHIFVRKIRVKNKVGGYIFTISESETMDEMKVIILDHAVTTVALEFSKMEVLNEHMYLMENNFFIDLIMSNIKSEEEVQYRVQFFSWPKLPVVLVIFDIDGFEEFTHSKSEMDLLKLKRKINDTIYNVMDERDVICTVIARSDSFSCILPDNIAKEVQIEIIEEIQYVVNKNLDISMTAGVASNIESYMELCKYYCDARDAIDICRIGKQDKKVTYISDVRFEQAMLHSRSNSYLRNYIDSTIEKLIEYDKKNNTQLVNTLEMLIDNMGIRTQTAEQLFVHRNTLLNRIRKIESITGYDLSRSQHLFDLGIALRIKKYL